MTLTRLPVPLARAARERSARRLLQPWLRAAVAVLLAGGLAACGNDNKNNGPSAAEQIAAGKDIFRNDTFGDETFWTDTLHMDQVVSTAVDPTTALSVGLKVDADAIPAATAQAIQAGQVDLTSPATTLTLLKLNAVVGVKGTFQNDTLTRIGITCALCHSTVDDSFTIGGQKVKGIGKRLDGWPNRDLNPGAIIALSPALTADQKAVYNSWGKGMYDPRFNQDHQSKPTVIPPAYGLEGVNKITYTGDGDQISYWNRYVAVTQMGGHGTFTESRTNPPVNVTNGTDDQVSSKLPALQAYQLSLAAPTPPAGSFDAAAATRGKALFEGTKAKCSTCHSGPQLTDANTTLHPKADSMAEPETPSYADRSATKQYRTSPLKGVWQHPPYFHDGSAADLAAVVDTYNTKRTLNLTAQEQADLVEYLKSL